MYYCDSVNGNDGNSGLTPSTAFKTISKLKTVALAYGNGVKIGLLQNSHWREELDLSSLSDVLITAIGDGTGKMPLLDASDIVSNSSFALEDGKSYTYSLANWGVLTEQYTPKWVTVWENDEYLTWVDDVDTCEATAGSFFYDYDIGKIYVHPTGSGNITTNGKVYEVSKRLTGINLGADSTLKYCRTRRNVLANGSFCATTNAFAVGCHFIDSVKHNSLVNSGLYRDCVAYGIDDSDRTENIMMEFYYGPGGLDCTYDGCVCIGNDLTISGKAAYGGHTNGPLYNSVTMYACSATKVSSLVAIGANTFTMENCYAIDIDQGAYLESTNNYITNCFFDSGTVDVERCVSVVGGNCVIDGMRFLGKALSGHDGSGWSILLQGAAVCEIKNSVFCVVNNLGGFDYSIFYAAFGATASLNFHNNIVYDQSAGACHAFESSLCPTFNANNNSYYPSNLTFYRGGDYNVSGVSNYFSAVRPSREANSIIADPSFVDASNGNFTITNSSVAAINAGLTSPTIDYTPIPSLSTLQAALWPGNFFNYATVSKPVVLPSNRPDNNCKFKISSKRYGERKIKPSYYKRGLIVNETVCEYNLFLDKYPYEKKSGVPNTLFSARTNSRARQVSFKNLTTFSPFSFLWDFGDGNTSTEEHPIHDYAAEGVYIVKLTATNLWGSITFSKKIYIDD
jgi:PKD repeat protein